MNNSLKDNFFNIKGRELKLPFNVNIKSKEQTYQVTATKLFKIAPNKRIVCSGKWGEERIVMKFFLGSVKANHYFNKEFKGLKALKRSGIRTPEIVFHGIAENTNIKVIATKEISPASDMMSVWNNNKEDSVYAELQKQIVQKIAVLHNAGIKQNDIHLGNFLISNNRIYTIDGDGVDVKRKGKPLPEEIGLRNLSILFGQFYPRLDKIAKSSLEYYTELRGLKPDPKRFIIFLSKVKKVRAVKLKKYLKKIFRECSEFVHKKEWNKEFSCDRKAYNSGLQKFIDNPNIFIEKGKIIKTTENDCITQIDIDNTIYIVKSYHIKGRSIFSERCLKKTRARISWYNAHLLKQLGIQSLYPICYMEKRFGPFCTNAFFIAKDIQKTEENNYSKLFNKLENKELDPEQGDF